MYEPSQELTKQTSKAKVGLMSEHNSVFITTILFHLKMIWDEAIPTAGTNGLDLKINPTWFGGLTPKAKIGLLAHEAWHVAFDHITRGLLYDPERHNRAADFVINIMLQDAGYELPPAGCVDKKYRGMSTEQVYKLLESEDKKNGGVNVGTYDCDIQQPSKEEAANVTEHIRDVLVKATTQSKMQGDAAGTIPGEIEIHLEEMLNPKLNWQVLFQNYMTAFAKNDYTYKKPNRRFFPTHYLPTLHSESLGEIASAIDSSYSVGDHEFKQFVSEINGFRELLNPVLTTIIDFDTKINTIHKLTIDQDMQGIKFAGRGGTNLQPVFDYYKDASPDVLVVFSDLYCTAMTEEPDYPVLWVVVNNPNAKVNFGEMIHIDI